MRFFNLAVLGFAALATAATITRKGVEIQVRDDPKKCLCKSDVDELVAIYVRILKTWDEEDAKYLHEDFYDWSDSINSLAQLEPGFPIFNKESFVERQNTTPDRLPVELVRLGPWNCDEISFIWSATFGRDPKVVRGLTIIKASKDVGYWQIKGLDLEFNSIQFLKNIGGSVTYPGAPPAASSTVPAASSAVSAAPAASSTL